MREQCLPSRGGRHRDKVDDDPCHTLSAQVEQATLWTCTGYVVDALLIALLIVRATDNARRLTMARRQSQQLGCTLPHARNEWDMEPCERLQQYSRRLLVVCLRAICKPPLGHPHQGGRFLGAEEALHPEHRRLASVQQTRASPSATRLEPRVQTSSELRRHRLHCWTEARPGVQAQALEGPGGQARLLRAKPRQRRGLQHKLQRLLRAGRLGDGAGPGKRRDVTGPEHVRLSSQLGNGCMEYFAGEFVMS
mmetsp:Transcript_45127/g.130600  ORF Transcript_45127/g.130600 Transcript_45127/m.130600 type:complete len:251 (+) Transcript_45127:723-1475(+)